MPNFAEAMDFNNLTAAFLFACGALVATASSTFHLGASVLGSLCFAAIRPIFGGESDVFASSASASAPPAPSPAAARGSCRARRSPAPSPASAASRRRLLERAGACPNPGVAPTRGSIFARWRRGGFGAFAAAGAAATRPDTEPSRATPPLGLPAPGSSPWASTLLAEGALWSRVVARYVAVGDDGEKPPATTRDDGSASKEARHHASLVGERPPRYNLFDPEALPEALKRFAPEVFASSEALGNFFGFQDDNVRNQAEHALMLLANGLAQQPPSSPPAATSPRSARSTPSSSPTTAAGGPRRDKDGLLGLENGHRYDRDESSFPPPVAHLLDAAPKTYLEVRTWLHVVFASSGLRVPRAELPGAGDRRLRALLVWDAAYTVEVLSGAALTINAAALLEAGLEAAVAPPSADGVAHGALATRLGGRFVCLVYQAMYLCWALDGLELMPRRGPVVRGEEPGRSGSGSTSGCRASWSCSTSPRRRSSSGPTASRCSTPTATATSTGGAVFLPLSLNYVGKTVHEPYVRAQKYHVFWLTLIAWKMTFGYIFLIKPMVAPTVQICDDYLNFPAIGHRGVKTMSQLVGRWLPSCLIFLVDSSIHYSLWAAAVGTYMGFRTARHRHPGPHRDRRRRRGPLGVRGARAADSALGEADEVQWVLFAEAWNDVVGAMRTSDTLNDFERDVLAFDRYAGFSKPVYLPIFVTAGAVERACALAADAAAAYRPAARAYHAARADDQADGGRLRGLYDAAASVDEALGASLRADVVATEAVDEVRELGTWLLLKLAGGVHRDDLVARVDPRQVVPVVRVPRDPGHAAGARRGRAAADARAAALAQLATLLLKGLKKRKPKGDADLRAPTATPNSEGGPAAEEALPASGAPSQDGSEASMKEETKQDSVLSLAPKLDKAPSMKRTQSTSGLAAMGASPVASDLKAFTPRGPAQKAKKYSLASTKYVAGGHEHDGPNDPFRDAIREKLRGLLNGCKAVVVKGEPKQGVAGARARELLDRLTFVLANERGFFWDGKYASACLDALRGDLARVSRLAKKLQGLLTTTPRETEPGARRRRGASPSSEDVLLSKGDLLAKNSDGVTTLLYLQTLYKADWASFLERRKMTENSAHAECFAPEHELETRLWASFRAQTLARTVEGMMHCEAALRLLARLERVHGARAARSGGHGAQAPRRSSRYAAACEDSETHPVIGLEDLLKLKFGYVVSCQVYGKQRKNDDVKAKDIELLLRRFPLLRVAYIDEQRVGRSGAVAFYSCLVKAGEDGNPAEVYRVRLPGNPVIGEGKPENQNHAIVFTRGECLQTIDMNQDGFFEEALKMRNLLQEFKAGAPGVPEVPGAPPTTIVGFREHIFTGSVSSLANYMALQELSFVTLGQRVLADPLHMRLHYGHPDVFDKLWFATRGGVSKASKGINLSEDIFAGYTAMIRGGGVTMKEYAQVATYLALLLAVYGAESIGHRLVVPLGSVQILLAGLGLLNTLPLLATLAVERGLWAAAKDVAQVFASGGPLYFIFHIQTRAHYFTQTILAGGATYRATGRGFVTRHSTFDEQYRFFAASHLHLGVELSAALVLMGLHTGAGQYAGRTWSLWLAVGSFLLAPFWFNPLGFSWPHVADDFNRWSRWISYGTRGGTAADSWDVWYKEETAPVRRLSGRSKALLASKALLYVALAKGLADFTGRAAYKRLMSFTYCAARDEAELLKFAVSLYYVGAAAALLGTLYGGPGPASYGRRRSSGVFDVVPVVVRHLARAHDLAVGYCYFAIFIPLSAIRICDVVQTWLLFHNALSEGVVVDDILKQARQSQEPDKPPVRSKSITSLRPAAYNTAPPPSGERFTFQSPDAMPPRASWRRAPPRLSPISIPASPDPIA
ncbi:1,3-beta-D-glucan synthase [Aureococcus anophagefferens]|nr:1,3-beta-D-glucan synthase [Aureococcus anophagefferens]